MTRRRWVVLGILLLLRLALPPVARRVMESRASTLLNARVTIGDVDFALWRGLVALDDVAVRPPLPPGEEKGAEAEPALIAWKRFAVNLAWFPLLRKTLRLESVELDDPQVALDRLAHGEINLLALVPKGETSSSPPVEPPPAGKPPKSGSGWGVGIDRFVLRTGHVRFRDFAVEGAEPVDLTLPNIEVKDVSLRPGLYGAPANARLDVRVDQGRLRINTRVQLRENGFESATNLRARRLPLRRTRFYVPSIGWRELEGELGASLVHRFASGGRHDVSGSIALDGVAVNVPEITGPALGWRHLGVTLDRVDAVAQRAAVGSVELEGASIVVRPRGGPLLPVMGGGSGHGEPPPPPPEPPASPPAATRPWHWSVASLRVTDGVARVLSEPPQDVGVEMEAHRLAGDGSEPAPVKLAVRLGDGTLGVDGGLRIAQPGFAGTVTLARLSLPGLVSAAAALPPDVLQKGVLAADLEVAAGSSAPTPGDVRLSGKINVDDPWIAAADAREFAAGWAGLEVGIDELLVPAVLAATGATPSNGPITVRLGSVTLAKPYAQLTRTETGLVMPPLSATPAESAPPATPPATPAGSPAPTGDTKPPAPVDVAVESFRLTEGRILVTDRTVKPFFAGGLSPLDIDVKKLRWPALAMERVRIEATSATRGKLLVTGGFTPAGGQIEVNGRDIALAPFNPYATSYSPYSIASGALTMSSKATFAKGRYDTKTSVKLLKFDLGGKEGDTLFEQQFGIPITVALALLKDLQGNIGLDVPVATDDKGIQVGVSSVIGQALRKALIGAIASPLKLLGAAFGGGGGEGLAPTPIAFRAGRAEPTPEGDKQVEMLAGLLASRPGIGLTFSAAPSATDVRWLSEQALREELAAPQGVFGAVKNLPERGARERVRAALEARAHDEKGELTGEDAEALERWLAERPPPGEKRLRKLSGDRLARLRTLLQERFGIGAGRVALRDPSAEVIEGAPAVRFDIGAAGGLAVAR
jgi:Domain of Unknown Function (DUF748)